MKIIKVISLLVIFAIMGCETYNVSLKDTEITIDDLLNEQNPYNLSHN
jgi:hypothetical protein